MLVAATAVFVYYTVWTLLMVWNKSELRTTASHQYTAICRRLTPFTIPLLAPSLGYQTSRHLDPSWRRSGWQLLVACHDQEQQEEGIESTKGWKSEMIVTCVEDPNADYLYHSRLL